ncbi:MAG: 7-carboxy-7-deazaguanine synthase [Alphaproteobacteria bacterium]|nr:7-carboxy-7-deazaguanine synthase [Alphaproteobacteria bacterium]
MSYAVKEIFFTRQGEGHHTGREAVFCRFSGCNLWNGLEQDRFSSKTMCGFCDTDFVGVDGTDGGYYTPAALAEKIASFWPANNPNRFVVCTGGEPLLQMDTDLVEALHAQKFTIAIETNGTRRPPEGIDWICVSPKAGTRLVLNHGNELKIVVPQVGLDPTQFEHLKFDHFFVQPMDGPSVKENTVIAEVFASERPLWKVSHQMHKIWGIR